MKKKLLAIIMTMALVFTMLPMTIAESSATETTNEARIGNTEYATLELAIAYAQDEDIIYLLSDVIIESSLKPTVDLTIDGAKTDGGKYSIGVENNKKIDGFVLSGVDSDIVLKNLILYGFAGNSTIECGVLYASKTFTGSVTFDNCTLSEFGKYGILVNNGTLIVKNCYIDSAGSDAKTTSNSIQISRGATATITDSIIINSNGSSDKWSSTGVYVSSGANATIKGVTFENCEWALNYDNFYDLNWMEWTGDTTVMNDELIDQIIADNTFVNVDYAVVNYIIPSTTAYVEDDGVACFTHPNWTEENVLFYIKPVYLQSTKGGPINCYDNMADALALTDVNEIIIAGNYTLDESVIIPEGVELKILECGTLTVPEGLTITNNGTIINEGTFNRTISFDLNGDTGTGTVEDITVNYGEAIGTLPTNATKVGYTLAGWEIDGEEITADTIWDSTANQESVAIWTYMSPKEGCEALADITIDADGKITDEEDKALVNGTVVGVVSGLDKESTANDADELNYLEELEDLFLDANSYKVTEEFSTPSTDSSITDIDDMLPLDRGITFTGLALSVLGIEGEVETDTWIKIDVTQKPYEDDGTTLVIEAKPMISTTSDSTGYSVIPNSDINTPITFRIYLPENFLVDAEYADVEHIKQDGSSEIYRSLEIKTDSDNMRYVNITVTEFSEFKIAMAEELVPTPESESTSTESEVISVAKTGDESNMILFAIIGFIALAGVGFITLYRKNS